MAIEMRKLTGTVRHLCVPSWADGVLSSSLACFENDRNQILRFIVDMQKEAAKRTGKVDIEHIKQIAEIINGKDKNDKTGILG